MNRELDLIDIFPVSQLSETEKAYKFLYMGEEVDPEVDHDRQAA
jgi:hypothetical protein